jgi:hypothetical protein
LSCRGFKLGADGRFGDLVLALDGHAAIGLAALSIGQAVFAGGGRASIEVGANGLTALVAYPASAPIGSLSAQAFRAIDQTCLRPLLPTWRNSRPRRGAHMTPLRKIAVIGNSLPRRCGIATFSTDLQRAIANSRPNLQTCIVAMTDHDQTY